jgi:hypothetical protein
MTLAQVDDWNVGTRPVFPFPTGLKRSEVPPRHSTSSRAGPVGSALSFAFSADPANRWMYPSLKYLRYFPNS